MTNRIYAYTVVGKDDLPWRRHVGQTLAEGVGLIKVGQTTRASARTRIKQQLGTAYPKLDGVSILLDEEAVRADGTEFTDHEVHAALVSQGIKRDQEWFEATLEEVRAAIASIRTGVDLTEKRTEAFEMRPEQRAAVDRTAAWFQSQAGNFGGPLKFLWNAKMRFGKTFTAYQLARRMGWKRVLVLTYKPAVQSAWRDDLLSHVDFAGWHFVDRDTDLVQREELADGTAPLVWFASFQDLIGRTDEGEVKEHNEALHLIDWDCIVLDEYHFGAWRDSARELYDPTDDKLADAEEQDEQVTSEDIGIDTRHILYLSGTPFRAITNGEFNEDQIFNWTYVDEQRAKKTWDENEGPNRYRDLPAMQMYSYEISPDAAKYAEDGEFTGFSLTEFFRAKKVGPIKGAAHGAYAFEAPDQVAEFLELLRGKLSDQMKSQVVGGQKAPFPYEHAGFKEMVRHSVWFMADVAACFAMRDMLQDHPYFSGFEIVVAAGPRAGMGADAKPPVETAIGVADREHRSGSITLSCGKLMTGVTIREWGAILMLRSLKSPETYFQAAFRVQSPWSYRDGEGGLHVLKDTCYVFEFDPNRALGLVAEYGTRLATTGEMTPAEAIGELLNYLPIFGFTGGEMLPLDANAVLDWATTGVGASALARRWNSPLLVEVNEHTLTTLLDRPDLVQALSQIEDFRALADTARQVVTSTKLLKKIKREQGGKLDEEQRKEQSETAKRRKEIREKLQKLLTRIPVFMYITDFREEALKHVIESLDSDLFERTTGLTVSDFKQLSDIGLFNAAHMNHAIHQFRRFELTSLQYALDQEEQAELRAGPTQVYIDDPAQLH